MCAGFVRQNARLADIGTDHAYLPLWLCLNGTCPSAVAADINPEPLSRGRAAIKSFNAEHLISARLSNGLENIAENEADDFVIAGMGGELIATILDSCAYAKNSEKHFILQPMTMGSNMCEALKELFADDLRESREQGIIEGRIELIIKIYQKGYTAEATADMLEEPVSQIRQIYDVIEKSAPDYDAETIYRQLREQEA